MTDTTERDTIKFLSDERPLYDWGKKKQLREEDWNFRNCPEEELLTCYRWEAERDHANTKKQPKPWLCLKTAQKKNIRRSEQRRDEINRKTSYPGFFDKRSHWGLALEGIDVSRYEILVDWSRSDKQLTKDFQTWLIENRGKEWKAIEARGRPVSPEVGLERIAARRLLLVYGFRKAKEVTEEAFGGRPLYQAEGDWRRAKHLRERQLGIKPFRQAGA